MFDRNISPAITEQLCKTVVAHETRHKSLIDLCENPRIKPQWDLMTPEQYACWCSGYHEAMSVVLEYIKSAGPAPRG